MPDIIDKKNDECGEELSRFAVKQLAHPGLFNHVRGIGTQGNLQGLGPKVRKFVEENIKLCQPDMIHICDGSEEENRSLLNLLQR